MGRGLKLIRLKDGKPTSRPPNRPGSVPLSPSALTGSLTARLFYFYIFQKKKLQKYILVLYPYRPAGGLLGGRDLFTNKNKIYLRINPWWGPAAPLPGGRPPTAKRWGGRYLHLGYALKNFLVEYTCKE